MKLSPIFPPKIKPARPGVYRTNIMNRGDETFQNWNGEFWGFCASSIAEADDIFRIIFESSQQDVTWQGLAEEPK